MCGVLFQQLLLLCFCFYYRQLYIDNGADHLPNGVRLLTRHLRRNVSKSAPKLQGMMEEPKTGNTPKPGFRKHASIAFLDLLLDEIFARIFALGFFLSAAKLVRSKLINVPR